MSASGRPGGGEVRGDPDDVLGGWALQHAAVDHRLDVGGR
jgi:hypothetical protein